MHKHILSFGKVRYSARVSFLKNALRSLNATLDYVHINVSQLLQENVTSALSTLMSPISSMT